VTRNGAPSGSTTGGGAAFATVYDSLVQSNTALTSGGGAVRSTLYRCNIDGNYGFFAGGALNSALYSCNVTRNSTYAAYTVTGGGTDQCTNYNCVIAFNNGGSGGGTSQGICYNCLIVSNSLNTIHQADGSGAYNATLYNCTVCYNAGLTDGPCAIRGGNIYNSIVYFNPTGNWNFGGPTFDHCCTVPIAPGPGNITNDPVFLDPPGGVFQLRCGSPCIDSGTNYSFLPTNDFRGVSRPLDGDGDGVAAYDIGAYEYDPVNDFYPVIAIHSARTNFFPLFSVGFYAEIGGCASAFSWDFGDGTVVSNQFAVSHAWASTGTYPVILSAYFPGLNKTFYATNIMEVVDRPFYYVDINNSSPAYPYTNWATAATNIQDAIGASSFAGRIVLVNDGVYQSGVVNEDGSTNYLNDRNRIALTNDVVVKSVNGFGTATIDGQGFLRCAWVGDKALLSGFTLTNGHASGLETTNNGGGAFCLPGGTVSNCLVVGNQAPVNGSGGGVYGGTLYNCILATNVAAGNGGGVYGGTLYGCILESNLANVGGGAYGSTLYNCSLVTNRATGSSVIIGGGGGAAASALLYCSLKGNSSSAGGGGASFGSLINCVLVGNNANQGAATSACTNYNCTMVLNIGQYAIYEGLLNNQQAGQSINCIVYSNSLQNWAAGTLFDHCCTTPLPAGAGNITNNPMFVDLTGGDLRLKFGSPCIDTGTNLSAFITDDFIGTPRPLDGDGDGVAQFDMGAYEFDLMGTVGTNWLLDYGLNPSDPMVFASDPDHDGFTTLQEWVAGTDPTNAASAFRIIGISNAPPLTVSFNSVAQRAYTLYSKSNLTAKWNTVGNQVGIAGVGGVMTLQDTNAAPSQFYKVGVGIP
jgi:hypothetical protein